MKGIMVERRKMEEMNHSDYNIYIYIHGNDTRKLPVQLLQTNKMSFFPFAKSENKEED
jgi:hypothetical protein